MLNIEDKLNVLKRIEDFDNKRKLEILGTCIFSLKGYIKSEKNNLSQTQLELKVNLLKTLYKIRSSTEFNHFMDQLI